MKTARILALTSGDSAAIRFSVVYKESGGDSYWSDEDEQGSPIPAADIASVKSYVKTSLSIDDDEASLAPTSTILDGEVIVSFDPEETASLEGQYFMTVKLFMNAGSQHSLEDVTYESIPYFMLEFTKGAVKATS